MKRFEILYNPYINRIHFRQELAKEGSDDYEWTEIESDSQLHKFQRTRYIFENCVEEILDYINKYFNTSGELTIEFIGTDEDFSVLRMAVERSDNPKSRGIICESAERYPSSSYALGKIRSAYEQIKTEFDDYIDNDELEEDDERAVIGRAITKFQDTVNCVWGEDSGGSFPMLSDERNGLVLLDYIVHRLMFWSCR